MSAAIDRDTLLGFLEEARGYLPAVRDGLCRFQASPGTPEVLDEAQRGTHTIKGAAALVGLGGLSHIAYQLEAVIERVQFGLLAPSPEVFAALEVGVRAVEVYLDGVGADSLDEGRVVTAANDALGVLCGQAVMPSLLPTPATFATPDDVFNTPPPFAPADETVPDGELLAPSFPTEAHPPTAFVVPPPPRIPAPPVDLPDAAAELLDVFRVEADEHLRAMSGLLVAARKDPTDRERWQQVRRSAHTLKGSAALVGLKDVTALSHRMEDLLDQYYDGERVATPDEVDLLLAATDAIDDVIQNRPNATGFAPLFERLDAALAVSPPDAAAAEVVVPPTAPTPATPEPKKGAAVRAVEASVRVPISKLDELGKLIGELVIARTAFEQRSADFARLLHEMEPSTGRLRKASAKLEVGFEATALAGGRAGSGRSADGFDDLEFDRYTEFHLISRDLAEATADVQTLGGELGHLRGDLDGLLTRQARITGEVEDRLMRLRMVPLGTTASKLQRTVRTAAQQTGKKAELVIDGEHTGLDKTVLDAMADPLLHLLRNAVDHGLETPEVRVALGKAPHGTIRLKAGHDGGSVVLEVSDDGRGIEPAAVRAKAVGRGLLTADDADRAADEDLFNLLFAPGFSTRDEVSELSGRGVGLDVVRTKVEGLKGTVTVQSQPGQGTTFVVRLPMTLAVTRALLVTSHGQTFAIPQDAVEHIRRLEDADLEKIGREPLLRIGGHVYPVVRLANALRLPPSADEPVRRPPVLLVKSGDRRAALVVDTLLGGREVVVKGLGSHLKRVPGVSGSTLTGDGRVVLILNPAELIRTTPTRHAAPVRPQATAARGRTTLTVLIVDDSPSVRRVLTRLVERCGWTPVSAKDGVDALEILRRGPLPDVVLSDIEMPRMDGYELLGSVRGTPALCSLPVVVITSRATDKHRKKAMDLGASAYLVKPYQDDSLADVIRQLTHSGRAG